MAFIDFTDAALQALPATSAAFGRTIPETPVVAAADPLSHFERRIVELARTDSLETLRPQRKRGWFARLIFGPQPPSPMLANEQLEALRRLAVQAWHNGYTLPASVMKEARVAGHSEAKIGAVIDFIGRSRAPFRRLAA
jgi:hypothetical protein